MANVHVQLSSFNAGELSPLLGARFAVEKVGSGCRRLRNFIPHVHGPAFRRPGMEYMGPSVSDFSKSRLEAFNFSTSTGFVLEFCALGLAVWSNGVKVPLKHDVDWPYSEAECFELQVAQVNDVCYLVHPSHPPRKLVRYADDDWRLEEIQWQWPALGDENVRADDIASPTVTELLDVKTEEWPEYSVPESPIAFGVTNPDLSAAAKVAQLWYWSGSAWVQKWVLSWTTVAPSNQLAPLDPARLWKMTYSGPVTPTSTLVLNWTGDSATLDLSVAQPVSLTSVSVPAGEWQALVNGGTVVPAGAKCYVQKLVGASWVNVKQLTITAGATTIYRGVTLTAATTMRLKWVGRAMEGGSMTLERLVYPTASDITLACSGTSGVGRTLTASQAIFRTGHIDSVWQVSHSRNAAYTQIVGSVGTWTEQTSTTLRVSGRWDFFTYGTWEATVYLEKQVGGTWEVVRSWSSKDDRNVIATGTEDSEVEMRLRLGAGNGEAATGAAVPRFVLEASNTRAYGLVRITAVGTLNSDGKATTATVDVVSPLFATDATPLWTEAAWSTVKGFPRAVALHGQRLWFGGTQSEPQRLWGSVVSDYENFRRGSTDDASVSLLPAAQQANAIQWLGAHERELVIGTAGDEWTLSAEGSGIVTPTNAVMQRRSGYGSSYHPAVILGEGLLFVQRGDTKLRVLTPRGDAVAWSAADLTVLAEHVTLAGVSQMATMTFPQGILWAVTADGNLAGMTYEAEQNVFGWHIHTTTGTVESVAVVRGPLCDEVWLSVSRSGLRQIERLDPRAMSRQFTTPAKLIYLDGATRFEFANPVSGLEGLGYMEGRTVSVCGDGAEQESRTVFAGAISLQTPARVIVVGLPYTSELQPMKLEVPMQDGTSQGRKFRVSRVAMEVHESLGGQVADGTDGRFETINYRRVATPMDGPPPLYTGQVETMLESRARESVDVVVRQSSPLPLNLGAITIKLDVYGE